MKVQKCVYEDVRIQHLNGTPLYKAPEISWDPFRQGLGATPRADMFSLGVVLLEFALQLDKVGVIWADFGALYRSPLAVLPVRLSRRYQE